MMKSVNVLLSAYNGEKYIREQIDSILGQTYESVTLYVRDDGSTDGTLDILREYEAEGKLVLEAGKNVGFIKSFFWLVKNCKSADYYAYSDQDDVWNKDKLEKAVEMLDNENSSDENIPLLYFSNYDFVDKNLKFMSHACPESEIKKPSFRNAIVDCMPLGFNSVFNDGARRIMASDIPMYSCGHDWWTYMVCQGMGKVIYDPSSTVKHRRTDDNVSAGGASFIRLQIWRIKKFFVGGYMKNVRLMLAEYWHLYRDRLSDSDRKLLSLFVRKKYNLIAAMKKTFYPHRFRQGIFDEMALRFLFIIGKL